MPKSPDFKTAFVALQEETQERLVDHPSDDELVAYHTGTLTTEEKDRLRHHLVECRICLGLLRDLESFSDVARRASEEPSDLGVASQWHGLQRRLISPTPGAARNRWRVPLAMAATFLLTAISFSVWFTSQQDSPRPNVAIAHLVDETSLRSGGSSPTVEIEAQAETALLLTPEAGLPHTSYWVQILDANGATMRRVEGLEKHPRDETFTLLLPPRSLEPGFYRIALYGRRDGVDERIAGYRIEVFP